MIFSAVGRSWTVHRQGFFYLESLPVELEFLLQPVAQFFQFFLRRLVDHFPRLLGLGEFDDELRAATLRVSDFLHGLRTLVADDHRPDVFVGFSGVEVPFDFGVVFFDEVFLFLTEGFVGGEDVGLVSEA